jgi:asparagine N-glycosylation enzyme membrane subunit Stt3
MVAIVATGLFFSAFDPDDLYPFGEQTGVSRLGVYSIGFLLIWLVSAISGIGTLYFAITNCMRRNQDSK